MTFKMRPKPMQPHRKETRAEVDASIGDLKYTIEQIEKEWHQHTKDPLDLSQCRIEYKRGYYDDIDLVIKMTIPESDEEFQERFNKYVQEMKEYDLWWDKNRSEINEHNREQREIQLKKNETELLQQKEEIEKKLDKIRGKK